MQAAEYLKKPYGRLVVPAADGTFSAEIFEFPGCFAVGDTAAEALAILEDVAVDWITATLEQGQSIPDPMDNTDYSGKLVLRMPKGIHKRATQCADREGVSLNAFIVSCVSEQVGARSRAAPQSNFHILQIAHPASCFIQVTQLLTSQPSSAAISITGTSVSNLIVPFVPNRERHYA